MEATLASNSITFDTEIYNRNNRGGDDDDESLGLKKSQRIIDREDDYRKRRLNQVISPERHDAFASGDKTLKREKRTYADVMRESALKRDKEETLKVIPRRNNEENNKAGPVASQTNQKRRNRWDQSPDLYIQMAWDATPKVSVMATPTPKRHKSRWDQTPATMESITPGGGTYVGGIELATPTPGGLNRGAITPDQYNLFRWEKDIEDRNQPLTDDELDALCFEEGYKIMEPPACYVPIRTPVRKLLATPTPLGAPLYAVPEENRGQRFDVPKEMPGGMLFMKPEDYQYFGFLLNEEDEDKLSPDEYKERKIMKLLLKVKNGTPQQRKTALKQFANKSREFGAGPLFNCILPLLMQPTLEDQERHLLVKVIDRVLYKLDELVRPYVHTIIIVIEPLLIDEDYYDRVEGREIIYNLSKAVGLATMIAAMRPDLDNIDEYVRIITARAFSVVASALGVPAILPFLKAVCQSRRSWKVRHTGIKIVQQIAILIGCAVLPHLTSLVQIIEHGLNDENRKVRTITALSLAALAESAAPYGVESFDSVIKPLWNGIRSQRGKVLAAFLKAIGFIIPLMDAENGNYFTKEVMVNGW